MKKMLRFASNTSRRENAQDLQTLTFTVPPRLQLKIPNRTLRLKISNMKMPTLTPPSCLHPIQPSQPRDSSPAQAPPCLCPARPQISCSSTTTRRRRPARRHARPHPPPCPPGRRRTSRGTGPGTAAPVLSSSSAAAAVQGIPVKTLRPRATLRRIRAQPAHSKLEPAHGHSHGPTKYALALAGPILVAKPVPIVTVPHRLVQPCDLVRMRGISAEPGVPLVLHCACEVPDFDILRGLFRRGAGGASAGHLRHCGGVQK